MKEFTPAPDSSSIVSVTDRVKPVTLGMGVTSAHFLGPRAAFVGGEENVCLLYTSPSPRDRTRSRMPSSA